MPKREKDTRKIVSAAQLVRDGQLLTFAPGKEDELEEAMTAGEHATLLAAGAIEGDWAPAGEPPAPMPGSRADRAANLDEDKLKAHAKKLDALAQKKAEARMKADDGAEARAAKDEKDYRKGMTAAGTGGHAGTHRG